MLAEALESEVADYIARNQERDENGRAQVVRNGKAQPRKVTLGSGTIEVGGPEAESPRNSLQTQPTMCLIAGGAGTGAWYSGPRRYRGISECARTT